MRNSLIAAALAALGAQQRDKVTGFVGSAASVSFDAYGCVQVYLTPEYDKKQSKQPDGQWFDFKRLKSTGKRFMDAPNFSVLYVDDERGGISKPAPSGV